MGVRVVKGKDGRRRFLWDMEWMVVRAGMRWDRWAFIHGNIDVCQKYFDKKPIWCRAFRVWVLISQMAGFTQHPDLLKERERWRQKMKSLDRGRVSEIEASLDMVSHLDMGLSAGELKRLKKMCTHKPNWRWNPNAVEKVRQINGRLNQ